MKQFSKVSGTVAILAAIILAAAAPAQAQNLVQNPGFESSTSTSSSPGWTLTPGFGTLFYNDETGDSGGGAHLLPAGSGLGNANNGIWSVEFGATDPSSATSGTL